MALVASAYLYVLSALVTCSVTVERREMSQRSSTASSPTLTGAGEYSLRLISANLAAFHSLFMKLRAFSNRSLTTAARGKARSSGFLAHWVENSLPHLAHGTFGSSRFFFVWSISAWQCGHSNCTGIRTSCVSVVSAARP